MNVLKDLWKDKPLFITVVAGILGILYILYRNSQSNLIAPTTPESTASAAQPQTGGATYVENDYTFVVPQAPALNANLTTTPQAAVLSTSLPPVTPTATSTPKASPPPPTPTKRAPAPAPPPMPKPTFSIPMPVFSAPKPAPAPAKPAAPKPAPAPAKPAAHTVTVAAWPAKNSTLFGIAQSVYGDGNQWPKIYAANKAKIGNNPNLIYAGTVLTIP